MRSTSPPRTAAEPTRRALATARSPGLAVADEDHARDAQQRRAPRGVRVEPVAQRRELRLEHARRPAWSTASAVITVLSWPKIVRGEALHELERDVAGEAVGHDDVDDARGDVVALDVARRSPGTPRHELVGLDGELVALGRLRADGQQPHARLGDAERGGRVRRSPCARTGRGTRASRRRWRPRRAGSSGGPRRWAAPSRWRGGRSPLMRPVTSVPAAVMAPVLPGAEEAVHGALAHEARTDHDRRVLLGAHGVGGVFVHRDDLGGRRPPRHARERRRTARRPRRGR